MRKALMAEQKKNEMQSRIKELEDSCEELATETTKLTKEQDEVINRFAAELQREEKAHKDQVDYLNALNNDYKQELETLLSTPAKWSNFKVLFSFILLVLTNFNIYIYNSINLIMFLPSMSSSL